MINNLSKDSSITRSSNYCKLNLKKQNMRQHSEKCVSVHKSLINKNKPGGPSFCGFFKADEFYKSDALKKILTFAADQQLVFSASFVLLLTCVMRPASIMVIPSKKNKDDQTYASAHSIASGVIGFCISTVLFTPISNGIKKFRNNAEKYIENPNNYLLKNEKALDIAKTYLDRLPDIVTAVPKGILTIALIPPILKYVFGMEKKSEKSKNKSTPQNVNHSPLTQNNSKTSGQNRVDNSKGGVK